MQRMLDSVCIIPMMMHTLAIHICLLCTYAKLTCVRLDQNIHSLYCTILTIGSVTGDKAQ
jgi:hypothetical protein